ASAGHGRWRVRRPRSATVSAACSAPRRRSSAGPRSPDVTPPVLLYTKTGCPFCDAKRTELAARGVAVREINVTDRPQAIVGLRKRTGGRRIVPVVVEQGGIAIARDGGSAF